VEPVAYSIEDAARVSNLPPHFIQDAITKGELPTIKVNRRRVILKTTLELWLKSYESPVLWPPGIVAYDPNRRDIQGVGVAAMAEKRLLRRSRVQDKVGIGRTALYELIRRDEFPPPIKIGRSSFWVESEIDAWIERRIQQARGPGQEV
jgi:prophage regulatory protein